MGSLEPFPHLTRAPIREAMLDVRVEPAGATAEVPNRFKDEVRDSFPDARPMRHAMVEVTESGVSSSGRALIGYTSWNAAKSRAVQGRVDGFSVHHVKNYVDWATLKNDARELWAKYVAVANPRGVVRTALRFINRIEVPAGRDLNEILLTRFEIGPSLPQELQDLVVRAVIPFTAQRAAALTQALEPVAEATAHVRGLIFDIEATSTKPFGSADDGMWLEFDELRVIKNRVFFHSLQKQAWEAFR